MQLMYVKYHRATKFSNVTTHFVIGEVFDNKTILPTANYLLSAFVVVISG